ncbi:hypothetical protein RND71_043956 [Anisodus tanguticus]|uniref:Pyrroline-5-carboxylate reductase dimerisation domain-containing protein n=1 Tax=Anisodus tanguticus TaxID=243964 RepID=A0AAE1QR73_9SOLA|nr:hypothetical protein RND71_043956 [Anisodus tanguticus]
MPNLACQVGKGVCGISRTLPSDDTMDVIVEDFLGKIFSCHFLPEFQLDQLTALSGSGIAFAFNFIQAMSEGGVKIGLPRELSVEIANETVAGACSMIKSTKKHPVELRDAVCSPAGTTIYGIHALQKAKFSSAVIDGIMSSYNRCIELKK